VPPWCFRRVVSGFQRASGCSHFEDGLELDEGVGEGIELGNGMAIPDLGMFEGGLVGVGKEAFYGGAFFENLLERFGISVQCEPELLRIVEIDGFGASPFGAELGMVAGTGDGAFLSLGLGVRTLISSSVGSFRFVEPCGFGFHFLSTCLRANTHRQAGSDAAAVWAEWVGFGVVCAGVDGDVGLSVLGIVLVSEDVLIDVPGIEGGVCEEASDEGLGVFSVGFQQGECEFDVCGVGGFGGFCDTDFDVEGLVFFGEDGGFPSPEVSDFLFAGFGVFFVGRFDSESCGGRSVWDVFFVEALFDVLLGIVFLDGRVDFGGIA